MITYGCKLESTIRCFVCKYELGLVTEVTWPNGIWILPVDFSMFVRSTPRRLSGKRPIKREHCVKLVVPCLAVFGVYLFLLHVQYCS